MPRPIAPATVQGFWHHWVAGAIAATKLREITTPGATEFSQALAELYVGATVLGACCIRL